jgi:hypothetical protein
MVVVEPIFIDDFPQKFKKENINRQIVQMFFIDPYLNFRFPLAAYNLPIKNASEL